MESWGLQPSCSAAEPVCTSRFHFIREIWCWRMDAESQYQLPGTPVVSAHFHLFFSFRPPLFWFQISPFNCHHLQLRKSVPLIQTHSYGLRPSVLFNSHTIAVHSFPYFFWCFSFLFFFCVQLISSDLMDEDGRCPADYQSRQMKAETGRQLADVFNQTHLRWIPTAQVCCPIRLNLSPFAVNWSCLPLNRDRI